MRVFILAPSMISKFIPKLLMVLVICFTLSLCFLYV